MGWPTKYKGPEIDEALEKGRNLRIVNNGWIRLESSSSSPVNLGTLKNVGNYTMLYYSDHPSGLSEMYMPININIIRIDNKLYQIGQFGNLRYIRNMDVGGAKYGPWEIDQSLGSINIGPTAPANPVIDKTIWLDTSDPDHATLKIYTSSGWKEVVPDSAMREEVYDTQGKREDIFQYIDKAISDASIGSAGIDFEEHITDSTIHVTQADKDKWNNAATAEDITTAKDDVIVILESKIEESVNQNLDTIDGMTQEINTVNSNLQSHIDNATIHPTEEQQQSWDAKADADHTHYLDGKVTVDKDHVIGELSSDMMPYDVKERVYVVKSDEERLALTKNPLHNGDAVCVSPEDGSGDMWYYVVDDTKLGDTNIIWQKINTNLPEKEFLSIYSENGKYFITTKNSNTIMYSENGLVWKNISIGSTPRDWNSICYGNNKYIAISGNFSDLEEDNAVFAYSEDGITWTEFTTNLIGGKWESICYGNGKYVASLGGGLTKYFAYSTDGIEWTLTSLSLDNRYCDELCYGNGKYIALSNRMQYIMYSEDGITWEERIINSNFDNTSPDSLCYGNGMFIVSGYTIYYSEDGITWEKCNGITTNTSIDSLCYNNLENEFIAVPGYRSDYFYYSTDGINWTSKSTNLSGISEFKKMCYGYNGYVGISNSQDIVIYWDGFTVANSAFKEISTSGASLDWNSITNKPTTIAGYGITDAASDADIDALEKRVEQAEGHLMTLEDLSNITTVEAKYDEALAAIEEIDSAFIDLDTILTKLENIAK